MRPGETQMLLNASQAYLINPGAATTIITPIIAILQPHHSLSSSNSRLRVCQRCDITFFSVLCHVIIRHFLTDGISLISVTWTHISGTNLK